MGEKARGGWDEAIARLAGMAKAACETPLSELLLDPNGTKIDNAASLPQTEPAASRERGARMPDTYGWRPIAEFTQEQQEMDGEMDLWVRNDCGQWCEHRCWYDDRARTWMRGEHQEIDYEVTHYRTHVRAEGPSQEPPNA